LTMTMSTARATSNGGVWQCPGAVWSARAQRENGGEDRCDGARACSGVSRDMPGRVWHGLGALWTW
jgi:hypothetical protein